jgi:hypothetical protein
LSASYKESLDNYVIEHPKRNALDDCNKAIPIARAKHALGIEKGEYFSQLYLEGKTQYQDAKDIAVKVQGLCKRKIERSKEQEAEFSAKIKKATLGDKAENPLTGLSNTQKWADARDDEKAEIKFLEMINGNADEVEGLAIKGLQNVKELRAKVEPVKDVEKHVLELNALIDDADQVHSDAKLLWSQWRDSDKDYKCGEPGAVTHSASQCGSGNTKYSPRCSVTCEKGYNGNGTKNALRCNRQGKFGKQLYGEWTGMAACVGVMCGKPPAIDKAKTVVRDIRYPHAANYFCHEGFSTDRTTTGPKAFEVSCGAEGNFEQNPSHVCKSIRCGAAPPMKHTAPIDGEFFYTEVATYACLEGFTVDGTPGGLKSFTRTCQATAKFTEGEGCTAVRCGPPLSFDHTMIDPPTTADQYFGDEVNYHCAPGYTLNQKPGGPDHFTLSCAADGQPSIPGSGELALPKCRPVSAGLSPEISHGNFNSRQMFYGDSAVVSADTGYTITGVPNEGVSFSLSVTTEGTYDGVESFQPVACGKALSVDNTKPTSFAGTDAHYGDVLSYDCKDGFSTDASMSSASKSFSIECEADATFSQIPGHGTCANIDDCLDHTCGPHGECVDHLENYTCDCDSGFEQTWTKETEELICGNIDDCGPEACGVGKCIDGVNDYKCDCPTGYEEWSEEDDDGKMQHTCRAVECGLPREVDHAATNPAEAATVKAEYQNTVVYNCDTGFTLDGKAGGDNDFSIECKANKDFTDTKSCKPVECGNVPSVNHASPSTTSAVFNESVRYDCETGHTVDGTADGDRGFTVTCQVTGLFGEPQSCSPISCGEPDTIANGNRPSGNLVYEDKLTYTCFNGFTLDGEKDGAVDFTVECHEDGKLDGMKQCVPKICGEPQKEINILYASLKDEGNVRYPQNTEIICRDGYTVGGDAGGATTFIVKCTAAGEFERVDERKCQPVKCGAAPPKMPNATLSEIRTPDTEPAQPGLSRSIWYDLEIVDKIPNLYKKGPNTIDVVPNIDYPSSGGKLSGMTEKNDFVMRFSGALNIKQGGEYKFELTSDDGSNLYINGKKVIGHDGLHGMDPKKGTVSLNEGPQALKVEHFEKGGGAGIVLKWKGPDSGNSWEVIPTSALETKGGHLNYEEKAIYKCNPGFTTGGEFNAPTTYKVECLPNGELSAPSDEMLCRNVNDCEQHTCGPKGECIDLVGPAPAYTCECDFGFEIQTSSNGEKRCGNKDDCQGKDCGVGVCKDLIGDYTCTCPSPGYYIGEKDGSKTCIPVRCEEDTPSVSNGRLLSSHSGAVDFPSTLRYKCDKGYSIDGTVSESSRNFQSQCKGDGQLFGMMSCQKISCGTPHVVPYTNLIIPGSPRRSVEYDDKAKYECMEGYTLGGQVGGQTSFEVTCKDDGVLTDPEVCEAVKCGPAPRVQDSRPGIAGDVFYGQELIYRCDLGHTLDGTPQGATEFHRQCLTDGSFSDLEITDPCQPVSPGNAPTVANADLTEYAGNTVESTPVQVFYPNGVEYRCKPGYSTNGMPSGPTKITARVNSIGNFAPALPSGCQRIVFYIRGRVKSARNGGPLSGVKVTVEGTSISATTSWGFFTLSNIPAGTVKLVYEKSGMIKTEKELSITGNVNSGGDSDINMSPAMRTDQWRAVVKWNRRPSDIDTYTTFASGTPACWYNTRKYAVGMTAQLEVDRTQGYGPETMFLSNVGRCWASERTCTIQYWIQDYGRTGSVLREGAEVTLYNGDRVAGTWKIGDCASSVSEGNNKWRVFDIDGKNNRVSWSCTQGAPLGLLHTGANHTESAFQKPHLKFRKTSK